MKKHLKIFLLALLFMGISNYSFGQNDSSNYTFDMPIMPEFPGGEKALQQFLKDNLVYPDSAEKDKIQGRVFVGFVVEKDGIVSDVKIVGKNINGYGLEEEALRVVKLMPKWNPGKTLNGLPTAVKFTLPISFKL